MKLTFEGDTILDIIDEINHFIKDRETPREAMAREKAAASVDKPVDKPVNKPGETLREIFADRKPVEKPARVRSPKQLENDAKLRERALAKKAAGLRIGDPMVPPPPPPPATAESLGLAPDEVARNRAKTIEDLQAAYANGFQKEVFELLSRFGNGAKSFRELPPEAFVPIREAIDNGALT